MKYKLTANPDVVIKIETVTNANNEQVEKKTIIPKGHRFYNEFQKFLDNDGVPEAANEENNE